MGSREEPALLYICSSVLAVIFSQINTHTHIKSRVHGVCVCVLVRLKDNKTRKETAVASGGRSFAAIDAGGLRALLTPVCARVVGSSSSEVAAGKVGGSVGVRGGTRSVFVAGGVVVLFCRVQSVSGFWYV